MEETQTDTLQNESPLSNPTRLQNDITGTSQSVSSSSTDGPSKFKRMPSELQFRGSRAHRVAQILWSTGMLDEPITSGFYSVLPERRLKEKFDMIPSLEELHALELDGFKLNVIVVDMHKDKKVTMLQQLALTLAKGLTSNPVAVIKKLGGLVCDFYKLPNVELNHAKGTWEEVYNVHNQDTVGLDCRLMVGLPKEGEGERTDSHRHVSVIVELNCTEFLVDIVRYPGHLVPFSTKAVYMSHVYVIGQGDSGNDSCDSPIEPNSPVHGAAEHSDEGLLHGEPIVANAAWGRNKGTLTEQSTPSSSPEHYLFRGPGKSILSGHKDSPRESGNEMTVSRSAGASPTGSRARRRRSSSTIIPEIGDDIVRVVRAINDTLKRNNSIRELVDEQNTSPDRQENASPSHVHRRQTSCPKAISLPSSPHKYRSHIPGSDRNETDKLEANADMIETWNKLLESSSFGNEPWFPYNEWNIEYSELTVGSRVGIGFFGEVFRGTWNGIEVAIKVLLEQEVTAENIEDFCNEISILSRLRHPNGTTLLKLYDSVFRISMGCLMPPHFSLITEYMDMGSLYYLIHMSGLKKRISWRRRLKMLCDICRQNLIESYADLWCIQSGVRGLMCMHRMKIVHRDLKSANCLVNKHWIVKICDFGLSRVLTAEHMRDCTSAGTPEWMAPELIRNQPFTEKCDIFSLGVIIWELCTLRRPWEGVPSAQVVRAVGNDGTRLDIPEGPLGNLIAGSDDNEIEMEVENGINLS
ncbi:serine/threonine-protein kinase EDR1 isoform X1 [Tanacetum coccineum]